MSHSIQLESIKTHLSDIEKVIGYTFNRKEFLLEALTHTSYSNEVAFLNPAEKPLPDNERLEFLGDAVIGLVVAQGLMQQYTNACEGQLSRYRSFLVSRKTLSEIAIEYKMGEWILLGRGERRTGGAEKRSLLAGVFEAIVGAIYEDSGIEATFQFLYKVYAPYFDALAAGKDPVGMDTKTFLQEKTQSLYKVAPQYRLVDSWGLEHEKYFRVEIEVQGKPVTTGDGRTKKEAEQNAALRAIDILGF